MTTMHKCDGCDGLIEGDASLVLHRIPPHPHPSITGKLHFHEMDCLAIFTDRYRAFQADNVFGPTRG